MGSFKKLLTASLLTAAGTAGAFGIASAASYCPAHESVFGTVERVNGNNVTLRLTSGRWATVLIESGARVNANGYSIRPGVYAGAFGCVTPNGVFHANEVSLASNANRYNETLSGVVRRIENGRLIVAENGRGYGSWYVPDTDEFHVGQTVNGSGMLGAGGTFYPQTVNGRDVAFDGDNGDNNSQGSNQGNSVTLTGVIQKVGTNTLAVWLPASRHTAKWVVRDAGRYHVGQHVVATGTEDRRGTFYPNSISIQ